MALLHTESIGDVTVLTWDDGENRFRADSVAALRAALAAATGSDGPAAVVLVGTGKYWSNGLDLEWMGLHPDEAPLMLAELQRLFADLLRCPAVTVAAVNGHAFAAGAMAACAFDQRVMRSDRGWWCLPEGELGLPFSDGMAAMLQAALPAHTARQAMLTAARYDADAALRGGIVDHIAPEAEVLDLAVDLATRAAGLNRKVTARTKEQLHGPAVEALLRSAALVEAGEPG
ncbi:MAG: enoyl-CoA hydratase/isomerase family protein [Acidimicrobiia bacterium]|nr:enoyl-CoA hydratase/isomerase family protein [Acidimicrobiia bacterium]